MGALGCGHHAAVPILRELSPYVRLYTMSTSDYKTHTVHGVLHVSRILVSRSQILLGDNH